MTDKQIIIDGFNLKYIKELLYNGQRSAITTNIFEEIIQKLERKEQECEKAKQNSQDTYDLWQALIESFNILQGEKIKLEQECEELKIYIESNEQQVKEVETLVMDNDRLINELDQLKSENDLFRQCHDSEQAKRRKLEQTLTEIKELVQSDYCTEIGSCEFCAEIGNCLNRKILQKISECEGNDEN